jgi:hypothetical protein
MRRRDTPPSPAWALVRFERMLRAGEGLELLRLQMPAGSTRQDARRLREQIMQRGRRPCRLLDRALGIARG